MPVDLLETKPLQKPQPRDLLAKPPTQSGGNGSITVPPHRQPGIVDYIPGAGLLQDIPDLINEGWNSPAIQERRERREGAAKRSLPLVASMGGGGLGSLAGAGAGLLGRLGGSALGSALGDAGGQAIAQGGEVDVKQSLLAGAAGGAGQGVGELAGAAIPAGIRALTRGGAEGRAGMQSAIGDAAPFGTTPTLAQATGRGAFDTIESTLSKIPGGAGRIGKVVDKTTGKVASKIDDMARVGGEVSDEKAGLALQGGIEDFVARFKSKSHHLFENITKAVGPDTVARADDTMAAFGKLTSPIKGLERTGEELSDPFIKRLATKFGDDLAESGGAVPFSSLQELRSSVGQKLGEAGLMPDFSKGQLKQLYGALSDDIGRAAADAGEEATKAFTRANKFYRSGAKRMEDTLAPLVKAKTPEKAFNALMSGAKSGPTQIRKVYRSLTKQQQDAVTGSVIKRMGTALPGQQGAEGGAFSFRHFLTEWNKVDRVSRDVMFSRGSSPNFGSDLEALARYAERVGKSSQAFANPSGTAAGNLSTGMAVAAAGSPLAAPIVGSMALYTPFVIGAGVLGANTAARLITSPMVVKWLAQGTRLNPSGIPAHLAKLGAISKAQDPGTQEAIAEYLTALRGQEG